MPPTVVGTGLGDVDPVQSEGGGVPELTALLEPAEPCFAVAEEEEEEEEEEEDDQLRAVKSTPFSHPCFIHQSINVAGLYLGGADSLQPACRI